jgi:type III secretory pathway component EscV
MKEDIMRKVAVIFFGLMLFGLAACSGGESETQNRLTVLEKEVRELKLEALAREKIFREELALIRKNLEGIQGILKMDKRRAEALDSPTVEEKDSENDINAKAKSFVNESLDRLLDITKKLLDKMEREFDEQMKKEDIPKAPEGDQV